MFPRFDLAIYSRHGHLAALGEIKAKIGTTLEWATQLRRNIMAHGRLPDSDFFLVVTPDRLYVWKNSGAEPRLAPPTLELEIAPYLAPYFQRAGVSPADLSGTAFELIVASWFSELASGGSKIVTSGEDRRADPLSEFLQALRQGRVESQIAA